MHIRMRGDTSPAMLQVKVLLEEAHANCQQETCRRVELEDQLSVEKKNFDYELRELEATNSNYERNFQEKQERE